MVPVSATGVRTGGPIPPEEVSVTNTGATTRGGESSAGLQPTPGPGTTVGQTTSPLTSRLTLYAPLNGWGRPPTRGP